MRRVLLNQRDDIVATIRHFAASDNLMSLSGAAPPSDDHEHALLETRFAEALDRWNAKNEALPDDANSKVKLGYFALGAQVMGTSLNLSMEQISQEVDTARRYTGWPIFLSLHNRTGAGPKRVGSYLEVWLGSEERTDVGHADFWRISPDGFFFSLRGYQEDSDRFGQHDARNGTLFEISMPVWRLGEFVLRVADISRTMFAGNAEILLKCRWTGLENRQLYDHTGLRYLNPRHASEDIVETEGRFPLEGIRDLLPEAVSSLTLALFERFDLFRPPAELFTTELRKMSGNAY